MKPWILFVEDDPDDREFMLLALRGGGLTGYEIVTVPDGHEGQRLLEEREAGPPALIITDLKLPKINGIELLRWLGERPAYKSVPKAVVTSSGEDRDRETCLALGAALYLGKPLTIGGYAPLVEALRGVLP